MIWGLRDLILTSPGPPHDPSHSLGLAVEELGEIRLSDPSFAHLTSYRKYRLRNTSKYPQAFERGRLMTCRRNM